LLVLSIFFCIDEAQTIAGTLYYKSPEMLLEYPMSDYSTDIWSLGCIFAAWLSRKTIFFSGATTAREQLENIMKV
jgi:casein kinase II subunit alpha